MIGLVQTGVKFPDTGRRGVVALVAVLVLVVVVPATCGQGLTVVDCVLGATGVGSVVEAGHWPV
jgi:hypothetical protein